MASNIKVTFNSLYTPDSYDTIVGDNPVSGKVYLLSDSNSSATTTSSKFTKVGIMKKDGVNYTGIVGINDEDGNLLTAGNQLIINLGDYTLFFSVDEYGVLSVSNTGNQENSITNPIGDTVKYARNNTISYTISSLYGYPRMYYIDATGAEVELADTESSDTYIDLTDADGNVFISYLKTTTENTSEESSGKIDITLKSPTDLYGAMKQGTIIFKVPEGQHGNIYYKEVSTQSILQTLLDSYSPTLACEKESCAEGETIKFTFTNTNKVSNLPDNFAFKVNALGKIDYTQSTGITEVDSTSFKITSLNSSNKAEIYVIAQDSASGGDLTMSGPTSALSDKENWEYSAVKINSITATCKVNDVTHAGYYREADSWEEQGVTTGWNIVTSGEEIAWSKQKNIAICTSTDTKPKLEVYSNGASNWVNWTKTLGRGTDGGLTDPLTIDNKQYYLWVTASITSAGDDSKIRITLN